MINPVISFCLKLLAALIIIFGVHYAVLNYLNKPPLDNYIIAAYVTNYILAVAIYCALYFLRNKYLDLLGFIFMAGSLLKFATFLIFFYPSYKEDGIILRQETMSFLIPYITCLIFETFYLVKLLNKEV